MLPALVLLIGGLVIAGVVLTGRFVDAHMWRTSLVALRLRLPANLTAEQVASWLTTVAATTHAPRWSLVPLPPVAFEIVATTHGICHYVLVSQKARGRVLAGLRAALPGVRIEDAPDYLNHPPTLTTAAELTMTSHRRPLAFERADLASSALLAALSPLGKDEEIRLQVIATSAGTPMPASKFTVQRDGTPWWLDSQVAADAEAVRAERIKQREALLRATLRVGVSASSQARAHILLGRVWGTLHALNAPGVRLVRRWLPAGWVANRLVRRVLPITQWPLLLNAREAVGLLGYPVGDASLPGLSLHSARQLAPAPSMPTRGAVVAHANYPGMTDRPLALKVEDRLRHLWVTAPTGAGKSTLLAQLALHDIAAGYGVVVVDPKNDLVDDILSRVPDERKNDVIALDPADLRSPVGFNILQSATGEHGRELVVDNVVHVFAELWYSSWGPRTSDVLRNALLTLTHATAADGSAFTLCEVPELLTNPSFRRVVVSQPRVPDAVRGFWTWYDGISEGERAQVIGPSLNKLRALTTRSALRLMLGQSQGIDLSVVFRERKILLAKLSKGVVGTETAQLLGALLVASLWQTALTRMGIPRSKRRPVFAYLDEFSDIVKLPVPLPDVLSQARGLGLSITLANQYAAQLPEAVRAAVLGTVRTQITFQCEYEDTKVLEKRFVPLTVDDLTGLETYEIAMRPAVNGRTLKPVTGTTLPLAAPLRDSTDLATASREQWGQPRQAVEDGLRARVAGTAAPHRRLGRTPRAGGPA